MGYQSGLSHFEGHKQEIKLNLTEFQNVMLELEENELIYEEISEVNKNYILENKGATDFVINQIKMDLGMH